jgi:hypothetical protein
MVLRVRSGILDSTADTGMNTCIEQLAGIPEFRVRSYHDNDTGKIFIGPSPGIGGRGLGVYAEIQRAQTAVPLSSSADAGLGRWQKPALRLRARARGGGRAWSAGGRAGLAGAQDVELYRSEFAFNFRNAG